MQAISVILAHQGGWDEALVVLVAVGLFVALFRIAIIRASAQDRAHGHDDADGSPGA